MILFILYYPYHYNNANTGVFKMCNELVLQSLDHLDSILTAIIDMNKGIDSISTHGDITIANDKGIVTISYIDKDNNKRVRSIDIVIKTPIDMVNGGNSYIDNGGVELGGEYDYAIRC